MPLTKYDPANRQKWLLDNRQSISEITRHDCRPCKKCGEIFGVGLTCVCDFWKIWQSQTSKDILDWQANHPFAWFCDLPFESHSGGIGKSGEFTIELNWPTHETRRHWVGFKCGMIPDVISRAAQNQPFFQNNVSDDCFSRIVWDLIEIYSWQTRIATIANSVDPNAFYLLGGAGMPRNWGPAHA